MTTDDTKLRCNNGDDKVGNSTIYVPKHRVKKTCSCLLCDLSYIGILYIIVVIETFGGKAVSLQQFVEILQFCTNRTIKVVTLI